MESSPVAVPVSYTHLKIVNVAEGTAGTDAVNVNQLNRLEQNVTNQIHQLDGKVNHLDDKINKVGAGAAALAALHPLDFDPDDKLSFSAGIEMCIRDRYRSL